MNRIRTLCIAAVMLSLLAGGRASAYADLGPTKTIRSTNRTIHSLLKKRFSKGTPAETKVKERLSRAVNGFLDFEELARRSLGRHWEKRTPAERTEFIGILRDLIRRNYVRQLRDNLAYKLEYQGQTVDGDKAHVKTVVKVKKNGRTEEVAVEYKMHRTKRGWKVVDVITDEVSIVRNYRSQFNRIIRRNSYETLVKKMKNKLKRI